MQVRYWYIWYNTGKLDTGEWDCLKYSLTQVNISEIQVTGNPTIGAMVERS